MVSNYIAKYINLIDMIQEFEHKYNIGDKVFYITPDSDVGIILDISFTTRHKEVKYEVAFGRQQTDYIWCYEDEITETKTY